ncbi:hypothetical protein NT6N_27730 [Oceaniferula spumae]|uniref:Uncharacterized protein n=1 Tax=Oceaniferula spumae TaxID=2979115 RepID=A0AAT9FP24_9BACT
MEDIPPPVTCILLKGNRFFLLNIFCGERFRSLTRYPVWLNYERKYKRTGKLPSKPNYARGYMVDCTYLFDLGSSFTMRYKS